jgi:Tol biopolymer transport system component
MTSRPFSPMAVLAAALSCLVMADPAFGAGPVGSASPGAGRGTWFDGLTAGVCFDTVLDAAGSLDFSVPAPVVACEGPHDNEIAATVSMGTGAFPTGDLGALVVTLCAPAYESFLGRPVDSTGLSQAQVWPDPGDWAAGVHDVLCIFGSGDPLVGTAASGGLVAPGETLAVYRQPAAVSELWLADAGTGRLLRTVSAGRNDLVLGSPDWTPDGSALAVTVTAGDEDVDAWLVPVDGRPATPLVTGAGKQDGATISPDGSTLAYISNDGLPEYDIFTRPTAGGSATRLTDHEGRDASPQWSPDGTQLLFRRATDGVSDIWIMNADGSDQRRLTENGAGNFDPRWSPDGSRVLFTSNLGGDYDIWVMNADGTDQRLLTDHPADDEYPTWSSDGAYIAFQSSRYGGPTIWLMRADGSDASLLVAEQPTGYPMFAPVQVQ